MNGEHQDTTSFSEQHLAQERVEILVEERSMYEFLLQFLPRILPPSFAIEQNCFIRFHQGKSDLQKSIRNKIRGFQGYHLPTRFIIVHDQDSNDCRTLKQELQQLCGQSSALIRIACRELESWYLGDMEALETVYPRFKSNQFRLRKAFRVPDECFAARDLERLIPEFQKVSAARALGGIIAIESNTSASFQAFVRGVQHFLS
ncbi:MAG: DUF4276 family protein [Candidatus Kapabacteria bacterium]|jgi:hypothetical protein|nr:DUF4276 family protein [Candidatus Kapabacteria bacterium]